MHSFKSFLTTYLLLSNTVANHCQPHHSLCSPFIRNRGPSISHALFASNYICYNILIFILHHLKLFSFETILQFHRGSFPWFQEQKRTQRWPQKDLQQRRAWFWINQIYRLDAQLTSRPHGSQWHPPMLYRILVEGRGK